MVPSVRRFEFGGFCLDPQRRTLADPRGEPVDITAKGFDALVYFVEHPGQVLERAVLLDAVWPNVVVEENNLSQVVAALRRVLGDGFIVTVPRRGYQFVADVHIAADETAAEPRGNVPDGDALAASSSDRRAGTGRGRARRLAWAGGLSAGGLVLVGTAISVVEHQPVREMPAPSTLPSTAVPVERQRLETLPTTSPEANVELLKSLQAPQFESRLAHLDRAIEIDPAFAEAYALRGMARIQALWNGALRSGLAGDVANAPVNFPVEAGRARADAERAMEIDPELGLAHFVLGATLLPLDKVAAEAEFERALALTPSHPIVLGLTAGFYLADLRPEEARALLARIEYPDPNFSPMRTLLLLTRDLDRLAELEHRVTASKPTDAVARQRLAFAEMLRGNTRVAIQHLRIADQLAEEGNPLPSGPAIYLYGRLGFADEAKRMFAALAAETEAGGFASDTEWIIANLGIGDVERAYELASRVAARPRPPWIADEHWLVLNPLDDPVLERPEFLALRRELGYRD